MKKNILGYILFLGVIWPAASQQLDEYDFVQVPQKFEFLKEENQYQLNALTAFLFEKFNFKALYDEPRPEYLEPCEILKADVHDESGLFRSRLYVTLEDCTGTVVFTSKTGVSVEKDYKLSYHEALREAFESVEDLQHDALEQKESKAAEKMEKVNGSKETSKALPGEGVPHEPEKLSKPSKEDQISGSNARAYTNGSMVYFLKKTSSGYDFFRAGNKQRFGRLIQSQNGENYLYAAKDVQGTAFFRNEELVVEYLDQSTGQVVTIIYQRKSQ